MATQVSELLQNPPVDDVDPELVNLKKMPRPRSAIVALLVCIVSVGVVWRVLPDLRYFMSDRAPIALLPTASADQLQDNRLATIAGLPDRRNALLVEPVGDHEHQTLYRLLGTREHQIFVRTTNISTNDNPRNVWTGRLRRVDAQPYAEALEGAFANKQAMHYLSLDSLKTAVTAHTDRVADRSGGEFKISPDQELRFNYSRPQQLELELSAERFAALEDAQHELEQLGFKIVGGHKRAMVFVVIAELPVEKRNAVLEQLDDRGIHYRLYVEVVPHKFSDVTAKDLADVAAVSLLEPIVVHGDDFVLTEGELPTRYFWAPLVLAILAIFVGFNLWYLVRRKVA